MNLIADTRTHTVASTRAYCALTEMAHEAAARELCASRSLAMGRKCPALRDSKRHGVPIIVDSNTHFSA